MTKNINPLEELGTDLQSVENPARYLGGEFGQIVKHDADFTFVIAFPDVYEIGMSNQAIKIIYNGLNAVDRIRCERVFTPEADFENLLKAKNVPLYTLETGIPLHQADVIGFSIGYELGISGVFSILDCGKIPLTNAERTEEHPIVIAGGCGVTNPAPFSDFFDAVFIGEAENELYNLMSKAKDLKCSGARRKDIIDCITAHPSVWIPGKKAVKAVYADFGKEKSNKNWLPIPTTRIVQGHGVVEIMRGCPNGCRFCHAGIFYRPQRIKPITHIIAECDSLIFEGGFHEISLTSLSSNDYDGIETVLDILNKRYEGLNVSFQLPSIKVNSFTLPLLEKISSVRKSGLTFAIETPEDAWQLSLNKEVFEEHIIDIIKSAKERGWNKAKFYFMVGLPVETEGKKEEEEIVNFMLRIQAKTRIQCNVNVGTFIPKPHTPYERVKQLSPEEAEEKLYYIRSSLPKGKFRVSTHNGFTSCLEGIISRGSKDIGPLLLQAYKEGARLDAWENLLKKEIWTSVFEKNNLKIEDALKGYADDEVLPWNDVSLGVHQNFFKNEFTKSIEQKLSTKCQEKCNHSCGICNNSHSVYKNTQIGEYLKTHTQESAVESLKMPSPHNIKVLYRVLFSFSKKNGAEYLPHLSLTDTFIRSFLRARLPVLFTAGFNPIPRLELASTLSLGVSSEEEIGSCLLHNPIDSEDFISKMNKVLPDSLKIHKAYILEVSNERKRESLASSLWGAEYKYEFLNIPEKKIEDFLEATSELFLEYSLNKSVLSAVIPFCNDRKFRDLAVQTFEKPIYQVMKITKQRIIAQAKKGITQLPEGNLCSYYDLYEDIAQINKKLIYK